MARARKPSLPGNANADEERAHPNYRKARSSDCLVGDLIQLAVPCGGAILNTALVPGGERGPRRTLGSPARKRALACRNGSTSGGVRGDLPAFRAHEEADTPKGGKHQLPFDKSNSFAIATCGGQHGVDGSVTKTNVPSHPRPTRRKVLIVKTQSLSKEQITSCRAAPQNAKETGGWLSSGF